MVAGRAWYSGGPPCLTSPVKREYLATLPHIPMSAVGVSRRIHVSRLVEVR
jgi:hypothetical protein